MLVKHHVSIDGENDDVSDSQLVSTNKWRAKLFKLLLNNFVPLGKLLLSTLDFFGSHLQFQ